MARPLRLRVPGLLYHVTARGNERTPIVRDRGDRQRFLARVAACVARSAVDKAVNGVAAGFVANEGGGFAVVKLG